MNARLLCMLYNKYIYAPMYVYNILYTKYLTHNIPKQLTYSRLFPWGANFRYFRG